MMNVLKNIITMPKMIEHDIMIIGTAMIPAFFFPTVNARTANMISEIAGRLNILFIMLKFDQACVSTPIMIWATIATIMTIPAAIGNLELIGNLNLPRPDLWG